MRNSEFDASPFLWFVAKRVLILFLLAWEPSVAQVTHSYSHRLPAVGLELRNLNIYFFQPSQLRISKPSFEHSRGSSEFPFTNVWQIGPGIYELIGKTKLYIIFNGNFKTF